MSPPPVTLLLVAMLLLQPGTLTQSGGAATGATRRRLAMANAFLRALAPVPLGDADVARMNVIQPWLSLSSEAESALSDLAGAIHAVLKVNRARDHVHILSALEDYCGVVLGRDHMLGALNTAMGEGSRPVRRALQAMMQQSRLHDRLLFADVFERAPPINHALSGAPHADILLKCHVTPELFPQTAARLASLAVAAHDPAGSVAELAYDMVALRNVAAGLYAHVSVDGTVVFSSTFSTEFYLEKQSGSAAYATLRTAAKPERHLFVDAGGRLVSRLAPLPNATTERPGPGYFTGGGGGKADADLALRLFAVTPADADENCAEKPDDKAAPQSKKCSHAARPAYLIDAPNYRPCTFLTLKVAGGQQGEGAGFRAASATATEQYPPADGAVWMFEGVNAQ